MRRLALTVAILVATLLAGLMPAQAYAAARYVALGDSVAAAAGLPLAAGTTAEDRACARSAQAYPYQVAAALGMSLQQLACSGAKADEGLYGSQRTGGLTVAPQLDRAFANGTPGLITITIGANDARWAQFIRDCYTWRCGSTWDDVRAKAYLADLRIELYWSLYKIYQKSNGRPPTVLLNGYFTPFGAQTCNDTRNITSQEIAWLNGQAAALNKVIRDNTAWFANVRYVPVNFSGHEVCTAQPWVQGLQAPAPFHPTAAGQAAIARANLQAL